jgi:hypothetical protein
MFVLQAAFASAGLQLQACTKKDRVRFRYLSLHVFLHVKEESDVFSYAVPCHSGGETVVVW